jgi:hypothetical protein
MSGSPTLTAPATDPITQRKYFNNKRMPREKSTKTFVKLVENHSTPLAIASTDGMLAPEAPKML